MRNIIIIKNHIFWAIVISLGFWSLAFDARKVMADEPIVLATVMNMPFVSEADKDGFLNLFAEDIFVQIGREVQMV